MKEVIWHTSYLDNFNVKLYGKVLSIENVMSDEITVKFNDEPHYGFILTKDNSKRKIPEKFFLPVEIIDKLPIIVTDKVKFSYKSNAYWYIKGAQSVKIPSEQKMAFRELVDRFADYSHSNPEHWTLYKIICFAGYFERLNIRIASEASFGKDGIVDILLLLNGGVSNLYKATLGKLKYSLRNDFIVINELGALTPTETGDMQTYLLQAGAYKPKYENNSRSFVGTKETMDLTQKSHLILHNNPNYYTDKGQKFFEQMFSMAVHDRVPCLLLEGYVTEDFSVTSTKDDVKDEDVGVIKDVISTINYYKDNEFSKMKYEVDDDVYGFKGKEKQRALRSFKIIAKYLAEYAESEDEFKLWIDRLIKSHTNYKRLQGWCR